jgi:hypothetical protein
MEQFGACGEFGRIGFEFGSIFGQAVAGVFEIEYCSVEGGYCPALFGRDAFGFCVFSLAYYASHFLLVVDVSSIKTQPLALLKEDVIEQRVKLVYNTLWSVVETMSYDS